MKLTLTSLVPRFDRMGPALMALLLLGITGTSASGQVLSPKSHPYGASYPEWSARWWQWSLEQSTAHLELVSESSFGCGSDGGVRFLAGAYLTGGAAVVTNKVSVSEGTPLFLSVLSVWSDNSGCPTFTKFTADELAGQVADLWTAVTVTSCTIDGVPVSGLSNPATTDFLVQAPPFAYRTAAKDNILAEIFGDTCVAGDTTIYPAVANGVYLMLAPLKPGKHVIHTVGIVGPVSSPFVDDDVTYDITVTGGECNRGGR